MSKKLLKCFISYSHKDIDMRDKFMKHFNCLSRFVDTDLWYDGKIPPGGVIDNEVKKNINDSDVIFLLVSPDFITSHYCYEKELKIALKRHNRRECVIIPIIIRSFLQGDYLFSGLKFVPTDGKPVNKFRSHDDGFVDAFEGIKSLLQNFDSVKSVASSPTKKGSGKKAKDIIKHPNVLNGELKLRGLNDDVFKNIVAYNNTSASFVVDMISVMKDSYETLCKYMSDENLSASKKKYWQQRNMQDFLFQISTYLQQHFIGTENTCVHFRVCKNSQYENFSAVGYNEVGLAKEPIIEINGVIEAAMKNDYPAIKSNNITLHNNSHPNETLQRDYLTCFLNTVYQSYGVKTSVCLSVVGRQTTSTKSLLTALAIIRLDKLIDNLICQYIRLCIESDKKYDIKKIFEIKE